MSTENRIAKTTRDVNARGNLQVREGRRRGWFYVENALMDRRDLTCADKLTYCCLARHADNNGHSFPSRSLLAAEVGICEATLDQALKNLCRKGLVSIKSGKLNGSVNEYWLLEVQPQGVPTTQGGGAYHTGTRVPTTQAQKETHLEGNPPKERGAAPPSPEEEEMMGNTDPIITPSLLEVVGTATSYEAWLTTVQEATNKPAALYQLAISLWPDFAWDGEYSRLGVMLKGCDAGALVQLMWRAAANRPSGHPLDYVMGMLRKEVKGDGKDRRHHRQDFLQRTPEEEREYARAHGFIYCNADTGEVEDFRSPPGDKAHPPAVHLPGAGAGAREGPGQG